MKYKDLVKKVEELEKRLYKIKPETQEEPKHEFKVGDRVQFKTWEEMEKEFEVTKYGNINILNSYFTKGMKRLCGTYATITEIEDDGICYLTNFTAKGETEWEYSLEMLKPAVNEPKQGDKWQKLKEWLKDQISDLRHIEIKNKDQNLRVNDMVNSCRQVLGKMQELEYEDE